MKTQLFSTSFKKGFTLIELLIVIAILGVLAAAVLAAIDPIDKINAANDSKVQSDVAQVVNAAQAYAASHDGSYPSALTTAAFAPELKTVPTAPGGYTAYVYTPVPAACAGTSASPCTDFSMSAQLKSKKFTAASPATPKWLYNSSNNKVCAVASATTVCP